MTDIEAASVGLRLLQLNIVLPTMILVPARHACSSWQMFPHTSRQVRPDPDSRHCKAVNRKRQVVRDLVRMVVATGSVPLAEGVEDEEEAQACVDMGFVLIQGFLTGRPVPADSL